MSRLLMAALFVLSACEPFEDLPPSMPDNRGEFSVSSGSTQVESGSALWQLRRDPSGAINSKFSVEVVGDEQVWQFRVLNFELAETITYDLSSPEVLGFYLNEQSGRSPTYLASNAGFLSYRRNGDNLVGSASMILASGTWEFSFQGPLQAVCVDDFSDDTNAAQTFCSQAFSDLGGNR